MAETPDSESVPSSSENVLTEGQTQDGPTPEKRRKVDNKEHIEKLEHRLGGILCCAVCLDLPQAAVYQCSNGHLMCAPCFTHLLADARLRDEAATCPNCRIEISKTSASRNLAVEKTVSELPSECRYCTRVFPRHSLQHHEENICEERAYKFSQIVVDSSLRRRRLYSGLVRIVAAVYCLLVSALRRTYFVSQVSEVAGKRRRFRRMTGCTYAGLGCGWVGPWHEARTHAEACALPTRLARDVLPAVAQRDTAHRDALAVYAQLVDLLSYEKITFNDLQLKPYRTEEYVHKLYYETARFSAFGHQWVVKAFVNNNQRDPQHSAHRDITYQLIMKSKPVCSVHVQWVALRGPYGEAGVEARVAAHAFCETQPEAPALPLPLADPKGANRLLANKAIHFRLIMFLSSK